MNMAELIKRIAIDTQGAYTRRAITEIVDAFCAAIRAEVAAGNPVSVTKFGVFHIVTRNIALNFNEGHKITRKVVKFRPFGCITQAARGESCEKTQ
jgi:nucleoid DNA-binding protein